MLECPYPINALSRTIPIGFFKITSGNNVLSDKQVGKAVFAVVPPPGKTPDAISRRPRPLFKLTLFGTDLRGPSDSVRYLHPSARPDRRPLARERQ